MAAKPDAKTHDLRTLFIRSVSFDAEESHLEAAFSEVGPVKQCFLVRVKGQPKHRGFGFVQFALPEDAERAVGELNGKNLCGRKLQ
ncbi:putative RNA-binding protein C4F6.14, partial [Tetrabaena socialis]